MTRKEDLAKRAKETTEQIFDEGVRLTNRECEITDRVILQAFQQVEREVLEKVAKHIGGWRESDPPEEWPLEAWKFIGGERDKLAAWLRAQQNELG